MVNQSLRAALGADRDPEFAMMLPEGWIRLDADDAARDALLERVRMRLMAAHRPDLWAAARNSVTEAFAALQRSQGVAVMLQVESGDGVPFIPASVTAAVNAAWPGT